MRRWVILRDGILMFDFGTISFFSNLDIDECARGTHRCTSTQICKNGIGYHVCTCPPGHKLNVNNHCEDVNECEYYRGRVSIKNNIKNINISIYQF